MIGGLESRQIAGVVLDVEGTTTPVSFVYDVLFPYARERLADYIATCRDSAEFAELERGLSAEWQEDTLRGEAVPVWPAPHTEATIVTYLAWLMDRDRKSTALKAVQGRIWESGFRDGTLSGQVYEDVPRAFSRWRDAGVSISIYSSGSVLAQQQLFGHSVAGDLTPYLSHYFDTGVGAKRDAASYRRIASVIGVEPARLLFISDVQAELDAAEAAGLQTMLCVREAEAAVVSASRIIRTFDDVD